jgi:hypothetical protein
MSLYYFHVHANGAIAEDRCGAEFASLQAAMTEALHERVQIMLDHGFDHCLIEVVDDSGQTITTVPRAPN